MQPVITTAAGRPVSIGHFPFPDPAPQSAPSGTTLCKYTHLDLTEEDLNCSSRYNCWGFTFIPRKYTLSTATDVDRVLEDNCSPIASGSLQPGDVVRYRKNGITTHTGRVWEVDALGQVKVVRSKWGAMGEYFHPLLVVPPSYGTDVAYFRQHAQLNGIADFWIADSPTDDGEQFSHQPWWTSPDIMFDVPPYDGTGDLNPQFGVVNRIWARIRNRADTKAENVHVKYYWADPSAGLGPADWHAIPATSGHPNPVGPLSIPPFGSIDAPYVEWTPAAAPAHQCLLAIAYVNDDPKDSNDPDPLVYTFDIPWDNNIAQRNVHIIPASKGSHHSIKIRLKNPFPHTKRYLADLEVAMTHAQHLPILGLESPIRMPLLTCSISDGETVAIKKIAAKDSSRMRAEVRVPVMNLQERLIAAGIMKELHLEKPRDVTVEITIPGDARRGSIYYIHVMQKCSNKICGGYTVAATVI